MNHRSAFANQCLMRFPMKQLRFQSLDLGWAKSTLVVMARQYVLGSEGKTP